VGLLDHQSYENNEDKRLYTKAKKEPQEAPIILRRHQSLSSIQESGSPKEKEKQTPCQVHLPLADLEVKVLTEKLPSLNISSESSKMEGPAHYANLEAQMKEREEALKQMSPKLPFQQRMEKSASDLVSRLKQEVMQSLQS